jgi:4-hydroxy-tetrahydrodipicolinate synthase
MVTRKLDESVSGVFVVSATPFEDDGTLDVNSLQSLTDFYIEKGVSGITILGMMGEAHKLSAQEAEQLLECVLDRVDDCVSVLVGVSNSDVEKLTYLANLAMDKGAAGVMIAPLSGLNTEKQIYDYFYLLCDTLGDEIPICYQDYPFATQSEISAASFHELVKDFDQLVMLKHEDWPGLNKITEIRELSAAKGRRRISIMVGNGGLYLPQELQRGADGAMTGFAYPEMLVEVVRLHQAGEIDRAEDLFDTYLPLVRYEQQPQLGLALRKEILHRRGVIASAAVRSPGRRLSGKDHDELTRLISRLEHKLRN